MIVSVLVLVHWLQATAKSFLSLKRSRKVNGFVPMSDLNMKLELVDSLKGHTGKVWCAKWNASGSLLASCGEDKTVRLWGTSGGQWKLKTVLEDGHQKTVRDLSWSPCGKFLATASFDGTTAIWDNLGGQFECNAALEGHENEVKSVSWCPSGNLIATCSRDKSVWIWQVENDDYDCAAVLNAHIQDVKKVVWSPEGDILASASYDETIKMFKEDPNDGEWSNVATLKSHNTTVWSISFDKTGTRLASCADDGTVKIWRQYLPGNPEGVATVDNDPTWKCVCTLSGYHDGPVYDIAWHPTDDLIATAACDNGVRIFRMEADSDPNEPSFTIAAANYAAHSQDVNSVKWHPTDPKLLVTAGDDSTVSIWQIT
uniref:Probable cytosolic iron-sulfur protein assembly protein Ciao1 n=1 Tax=Lygus hesperus TaxID=30085 RepID=A0A146LGL8_LYGHE